MLDVHRIVRELRHERKWLEEMIGAVELASAAPAHRFLRAILSSMEDAGPRWRGYNLSRREKLALTRLAAGVKRSRTNLSRRRAQQPHGPPRMEAAPLKARVLPFELDEWRKFAAG